MDVEKLKLEIKEQEAIIEKKNEKIDAANAQLLLAPIKEDGTLLPHIQSAINGIDEQIVKLNEEKEEAQTKKFHLEIKLAEIQGDVEEKADFEEQLQRLKSKAKKREANDSVDDIERKKSKTELFWTELMEADLESDVIEFSDHPFLDDQFPKKFWIRPKVYKEYCGYIEKVWETNRLVYLSGSPGIGKSAFALYLMAHLLLSGQAKEIVYFRTDEFFHLTLDSYDRISQEQVSQGFIGEKSESEDVVVIYDSPEYDPPTLGRARILLISSPKCNPRGGTLYKRFVNDYGCKRLFFPSLNSDEVDEMLSLVPRNPESEYSVEYIREHIGIGFPRAFYMDEFIEGMPQRRLNAREKYIEQIGAHSVDGVPHCIMTIVPELDPKKKLPSGYSLGFTCEESKRSAMKWEFDDGDKMRIRDDAFDASSPSAGLSFEIFAHDHFAGGKSQSFYRYGNNNKCLKSKFAIKFTGSRCPFPKMKVPEEIEYGNYYVPDVPNFGNVDSFGLTSICSGTATFKKKKPLFLFQMTVSTTHSFDEAAIEKLIDDLDEVNDDFDVICFVWVLRKGQTFKPDGGTSSFKVCDRDLFHFRYDLEK